MPLLETSSAAGKARRRRGAATKLPPAAAGRGAQVYLVDKPGAAQSQIRIGMDRRAALDARLLSDPGA